MDIVKLIKDFGFPIVAAVGLGYFVYYVWQWSTKTVKPVIGDANKTLIALIDRIRMLDNDLIRLNQKLNMILEYQENQKIHKTNQEEDSDEVSKRNRKKTME
jgi:hypothetical protein